MSKSVFGVKLHFRPVKPLQRADFTKKYQTNHFGQRDWTNTTGKRNEIRFSFLIETNKIKRPIK